MRPRKRPSRHAVAGFSPPLNSDELAFYDAVAQNESAVTVQGDDFRAKLRSSIKWLLIKHRYPPDKQPCAIKLVLEQMESLAPRYAADRT